MDGSLILSLWQVKILFLGSMERNFRLGRMDGWKYTYGSDLKFGGGAAEMGWIRIHGGEVRCLGKVGILW